MDRRRFLQIAGLAGLSIVAPLGISRVRAESSKYDGPYWIMVNAGGGWDPTMFCDPKGGKQGDRSSVNQAYTPDQIVSAGGIPYAPIAYSDNGVEVFSCKRFFETHHKRLMVLNGVDTTTNNHDSGSRTVWSGQLSEGYPSFAALVAGIVSKEKSLTMAYLSAGGYDATQGVVSVTRTNGIDAVQRLAYPNVINPDDQDSDRYNTNETAGRIFAAQQARIAKLRKVSGLPSERKALSSLYVARTGDDGLGAIAEELAKTQLVSLDDFPDLDGAGGLGDLEDLVQQAQIALIAFKVGVAVSANLDIGGYDTHDDNDDRQAEQLSKLLRGLDYLFKQIDAMGLTDKVYVVVGSDFGRTPSYNGADGKDHWNITSMMFSGPGIQGDRVVGSTTDAFKASTFNTSLKEDANGFRIDTRHVHRQLRKLAGVDETDLAKQFPIGGEDLPLFG